MNAKIFLSQTAAKQIAAVAEKEAIKNNWNVAIAIVNEAGQLLFFTRMDESTNASGDVSIAKARHAAYYRRDTKFHEALLKGGNNIVLGLPGCLPVEGGVMLIYQDRVIGAIGVSGAASHEDGLLARLGADFLYLSPPIKIMTMTEIKKAALSELDPLAQLFDQYRIFYKMPSDIEGAKKFLLARMANNDAAIFICSAESIIVGFVQLYPLFSSTRMQKLWLLNDLYVAQQYRGKGYSINLIDKAKELCAETGACGLILETARGNMAGNNLYPRMGFRLDAEHNYYSWDTAAS
jgi:uncharacterized protein GlcG (DUF336 family)/GNAT superfamily N-acetyltransferase